jgi:hypothetical protein
MSTLLETTSGARGGLYIGGTTLITRPFNSIQINADAVIEELYYSDEPATNQALAANMNLAANTLTAGIVLLSKSGRDFSSIKLTSGSVIVH